MNIQQIEEALSIADTSLRCQRVLDEVQPVLRQLMDEFKLKYASQAKELLDYQVHTYELTLRTTMNDARNPKYAEKKQDTDIGKKAFVELIDKQFFETEYGTIMLELNGLEKKLKIIIRSSFYPLWAAIRTQECTKELIAVIQSISDDIYIQTDTDMSMISKSDIIPYIQQCAKENRTPWLYFGYFIDFDQIPSDSDLINLVWNAWLTLEPLRNLVKKETASHSLSLRILDQLKRHREEFSINLYGKNYDVRFEDVSVPKTNRRRQEFGIYDKGQLITNGRFEVYLRDPTEEIGLKINSGNGVLFSNLRVLHQQGQVQWYISKSFKTRRKDNSTDLNKEYLNKAIEDMFKHGLNNEGSKFFVGTWDNDNLRFIEPVAQVKKTLIIAAVIFADCLGEFIFPKEDYEQTLIEDGEEETPPIEEAFNHDFNLATILSNVRESPFTYADSIIRDFHLNLVSLEDKHFVILNGISGTGKTKLCLLYANAVYGRTYDSVNPYLKVIPVRPDWMDSTSLFGYYSALEKRYVRTPFLNAVLQAIQEGKPMFIVLDEMNLARVEYYLSDYLSAIESRQPIRLHSEDHIADVPQELQIPHNLYVIGTINVDETTHSISDKVLDRAFVMTLSDVDLDQFWMNAESKYKSLHEEWDLLHELHRKLNQFDLHFGYRTMNEMLRKLYMNANLAEELQMGKREAVDRVIAEKVLPKIRGDERIDSLLVELINWTRKLFGDGAESLNHLLRMKGELDRNGATQFWR